MKIDFQKKIFIKYLNNIILSSTIFLVVSLFLIYNFVEINNNISSNLNLQNNNIVFNNNFLSLFLCLLFSIVVFASVFFLLDYNKNKNFIKLNKDIEKIINSDLNTEISIDNINENYEYISKNLNMLQFKINELINNEKKSENVKNELITNIAHDLRTPLTSIIGFLQILETNKDIDDDKKKEYIKIAYEKSKKLENLVEDLFSLTKLSYNEYLVQGENFDIVQLLNQLIQEMYPLFEKNNINYEFVSNIKKLDVYADSKLIVRLFENLLNNAIKYGKTGKKIIIKLNLINSEVYEVSIINFGKIIPKDSLDRLFDRFYRVDQSRNSQIEGTGLGLAIAKNIIDIHNGIITVKSDLNGTEFNIKLNINTKFKKAKNEK